ncbi:hypothetical protein CCP4SC76_1850003 [Gammaproteobacteria bacterium]
MSAVGSTVGRWVPNVFSQTSRWARTSLSHRGVKKTSSQSPGALCELTAKPNPTLNPNRVKPPNHVGERTSGLDHRVEKA